MGAWERGELAGQRRGWLDDHCYRMYCVGADQETAKGARGAHLHPQSGDANEEPGRVVLGPRTVTPVQSLPHCSFACASLPACPIRLAQASPSCGVCVQERGTAVLP